MTLKASLRYFHQVQMAPRRATKEMKQLLRPDDDE